jgi:hypothetical protein
MKYFYLEKLPMDLCTNDKAGRRLLNKARIDIANHLRSEKCNEWKSGFLTDNDILKIEKHTNRKVKCSVESGEYFYRLQ